MKIFLAENAGFCFGVKSAVLRVSGILNQQSPLYIDGQIIHNPDIAQILEARGLKTTGISKIPPKNTVVIRTHGAEYSVLKNIISSSNRVINLTCPRVSRIQGVIKKFIKNGYYIIITGDPNHPEVRSLASYTGGHCTVISTKDDAKQIPFDKKVLLISQTTFDHYTFDEISTIALKINPETTIINTICDSTRNRQSEIEKARMYNFDTIVVIGGKNSANTKSLAHIAEKNNLSTILIENENNLSTDMFIQSKKVLISAGASTPTWVIDNVLNRMLLIKLTFSSLPGFLRHIFRLFSAKESLLAASGLFSFSVSLFFADRYNHNELLELCLPAIASVSLSLIWLFFINSSRFLRKQYQFIQMPILFIAVFSSSLFIDNILLQAGYSLIIVYFSMFVQTVENIFDYEKNIIFGIRTPVSICGIKPAFYALVLFSTLSEAFAIYSSASAEIIIAIALSIIILTAAMSRRPLFTSVVRFTIFLLSAVFSAVTLVRILM
jgi:4-hydroxy-3-methylbut-2-en-1-yl diphosphate reductase